MNKQKALEIVKGLSDSTWLASEKDEAIRIVMNTSYASYQLNRGHLLGMLDFIYEHYMKGEDNESNGSL